MYHVIIALNSVGKRRVGQIISALEEKGFELTEIRKKKSSPKAVEFPSMKHFVLQCQLNELDAMAFYREMFSELVLKRKINHFLRNHVELFFENEEKIVDPHELWETCRQAFGNDRKLPIMFVTTTSGENGFDGSLIPDDFEPDLHDYFNPRTAIPLDE